jgi:cleavage and polyadenylation specificity factor subunit 5
MAALLPIHMGPSCNIYPPTNYVMGTKEPKYEKESSVKDRLDRMAEQYKREGMRRVVEGVLLVHAHGHPHVLLLQIGNTFYKLPGGKLKIGEGEVEGLKRKLANKLASPSPEYMPDWEVGELLCVWWRPNDYENNFYPYVPAHVTKPRESRKVFLVHLPEKAVFNFPRNLKLVAVPLFELIDNGQKYGQTISCLPQLLSRVRFNCL